MNTKLKGFCLVLTALLLAGCSTTDNTMQTAESVDIEQFMGDWYVIANIPTYFEKKAFNPIERYAAGEDGKIETSFIFNSGSADGPLKIMSATGFVKDDKHRSTWGMQFIWPIKADYRIVYVDAEYQHTIVGRAKRDYLWIMARQHPLSAEKMAELIGIAESAGYSRKDILLTNWQQQPLEEAS